MKKDIILAGVGGQGILTIATIIGAAATRRGVNLKQAEVHGMSQRGGDVQSGLRLSQEPICSDMVPLSQADLIVSMEPMEALRYLPYLQPQGWVVSSSDPVRNISPYPEPEALEQAFKPLPHVLLCSTETLAREYKMPKCANVILLGLCAPLVELLSPDDLRQGVEQVFRPKGQRVVEMNLQAFDLGLAAHLE